MDLKSLVPASQDQACLRVFPQAWLGVDPSPSELDAETCRLLEALTTGLEPHTFSAGVPSLAFVRVGGVASFEVTLDLGQHAAEEWLLVKALWRVPGVLFTTEDTDGNFVLVALSADLPDWLDDADAALNRVFFGDGRVHIVHTDLQREAPSLLKGLQLATFCPDDCVDARVQCALERTLADLDSSLQFKDNDVSFAGLGTVHVPAILPEGVARLLAARPSLVALALSCLPPVEADCRLSDKSYEADSRRATATVAAPAFSFQECDTGEDVPDDVADIKVVPPPTGDGSHAVVVALSMSRFQLARLSFLRLSPPAAFSVSRWKLAGLPLVQARLPAQRGAWVCWGLHSAFRLNSPSFVPFSQSGSVCVQSSAHNAHDFRLAVTLAHQQARSQRLCPLANSSFEAANPSLRADWLAIDGTSVEARMAADAALLADDAWLDDAEAFLAGRSGFSGVEETRDDDDTDDDNDDDDSARQEMERVFSELESDLAALGGALGQLSLDESTGALRTASAMEGASGPTKTFLRNLK